MPAPENVTWGWRHNYPPYVFQVEKPVDLDEWTYGYKPNYPEAHYSFCPDIPEEEHVTFYFCWKFKDGSFKELIDEDWIQFNCFAYYLEEFACNTKYASVTVVWFENDQWHWYCLDQSEHSL